MTNQNPNTPESAKNDRMMKWFAYEHLPPHLQEISKIFHDAAIAVIEKVEIGPERTVALRKLLEAKDAGVRGKLHPGG